MHVAWLVGQLLVVPVLEDVLEPVLEVTVLVDVLEPVLEVTVEVYEVIVVVCGR